ncbi:MAG: helix-turn-helix transcriptional regulator [Bacilli bacterium]|nr:helix-turn-helix transcriptional regulator [Bacilli bacterium]
MHHIENNNYKQIYFPDTIKKIINYLDIEKKIIWNDKYLKFIIYDEYKEITNFRLKANLNKKDMASLLNVNTCTLSKWEKGISKISRKNYDKFKLLLDLQNKKENYVFNDNYLLFLKNNPQIQILNYIKKEQVDIKEFSKRMNRHPINIKKMINGRTTITRKQYYKFKELLKSQELGIITSDPYINFIKTEQANYIYKFLKNNNMSRAELSRKLSVGRCTVERWIRNEIVISKKNYYNLMNFVNEYTK